MKARAARKRSRSVYLLQHIAREGRDDEDVKTLGAFSSQREAALAVSRLKKLAGFKRYPDGFHIDRFKLNRCAWREGFNTIQSLSEKAAKLRKRSGK